MEAPSVDPALRQRPLAPGPLTADSTAADARAAEPVPDRATIADDRLLRGDSASYEFFQAMRLLRQRSADAEPVGGYADPASEFVRLGVDPDLAFPPGDIASLTDAGDGPPRLSVNFMGLTGPSGVLPQRYTLQAAERQRARDHAMRDFLDIFHHRLLSLFHLAWEKHRFAIAYERDGRDHLTRHLLDLIGLGTDGLSARLGLAPEALLFHAGLLSLQPRPAVALEQLLEGHFGVPVEIEQFVGGWHAIHESAQCSLGDDSSPASQLGFGAVVGDEIWEHQSRARVRIGPMPRSRYDDFLPTGSAWEPLRAIIRFFTSDEVDVEIQLVLEHDAVPPCLLGVNDDALSPPLGWCTWLPSRDRRSDPDDAILSLADPRTSP